MTASNYEACLTKVLRYEGGYVNDPHDPGGETNYGITAAVARASGYRGAMRNIPMDLVRSIYRQKYWDAVSGDSLPAGLDLAVFDYAVNSGVSRAKKALVALGAQHATDDTIRRYCAARLSFLKGLSTWPRYGKGWGSRVADVQATALRMVIDARAAGSLVPDGTLTSAQIGHALPQAPVEVTPIALPAGYKFEPLAPAAAPAPATAPPAQQPKHDGWFAGATTALMAVLAAAWTWLQEWLPEILLGLAGLIILALIIFRLVKGHFPWTHLASTGDQSPAPLRLSLPNLAGFSATPSRHLEQLSAALQELHSLAPSAPARRRKRSDARSPRTRRRPRKSKGSKPSTPTRSSSRRKSRSKR